MDLWCTQSARDRLPSTPRRYQAVAEAITDTQLASDEVTELSFADLFVLEAHLACPLITG